MQIKYMGSIIHVNEPSNVKLHSNFVEILPLQIQNIAKPMPKAAIAKPAPKAVKKPGKPSSKSNVSASAQIKIHVREYLKKNGPSKNTNVLKYVRENIDCSKYSRNLIYVAVLGMKDVVFTGNRENRIWSIKGA